MAGEQPVEGSYRGKGQWPFDVAKQDNSLTLGAVLCVMDVGLVKHHRFPVFPAVALTVHFDEAVRLVFGRDQPQVVAQRAGFCRRAPGGSDANIAAFTLGRPLSSATVRGASAWADGKSLPYQLR